MAVFNVHAGHAPYTSGGACGAVGILNESNEARAVKDELKSILESRGHTVYDCTCEEGLSQNKVLKAIVTKCNKHLVDLDISIHLNSGRKDKKGDGKTGGVEVYGYNKETQAIGQAISNAIATGLNIADRGFKVNNGLYVLKNTKNTAILIECCFVDDKDDADKWNAKKCARQIADAIRNAVAEDEITTNNNKQTVNSNKTTQTNINNKKSEKAADSVPVTKWVGKVTANLLNVRQDAGIDFPNLAAYPKLAKGNLVDVLGDKKSAAGEKWFYIRIAGKYYGYVMAKYIEKNK